MARIEDWSLLPAWLQTPAENWEQVAEAVAQQSTEAVVERGRLMGLALSFPAEPLQDNWRDSLQQASGLADSATSSGPVGAVKRAVVLTCAGSMWF